MREGLRIMAVMSANAAHSLPELHRLLSNLLRTGRVERVQTNPPRCRVRTGELLTTWVPWFSLAAGGDQQTRHWRTPAVGEPCMLLAPGGDLAQACALVGLFSTDMPQGADSQDVERHDFSATDFWQHSRTAGALNVEIANAITMTVGASVLHITPDGTTLTTPQLTVDSAQSTFTGAVTVEGLLTYMAGMAGQAGAGGSNTIQGGFAVDGGAITHNGKSIGSNHTHGGVQTGGGNTGAPN